MKNGIVIKEKVENRKKKRFMIIHHHHIYTVHINYERVRILFFLKTPSLLVVRAELGYLDLFSARPGLLLFKHHFEYILFMNIHICPSTLAIATCESMPMRQHL